MYYKTKPIDNNPVWIHYSNEHHTTQPQLLSIQLYAIACKVAKVPHLKTKPVLCQKNYWNTSVPKTNLAQCSDAELCKLCHCEADNYTYPYCRYMMIATFYYQLYGITLTMYKW